MISKFKNIVRTDTQKYGLEYIIAKPRVAIPTEAKEAESN